MTCLNQDPNQVRPSCGWLRLFHLSINLPCFRPPTPSPALPGAEARALPAQRLQALAACFLLVPPWFLHLHYRPETLSLWLRVPSWRACVCVHVLPGRCWPPRTESKKKKKIPVHLRRLKTINFLTNIPSAGVITASWFPGTGSQEKGAVIPVCGAEVCFIAQLGKTGISYSSRSEEQGAFPKGREEAIETFMGLFPLSKGPSAFQPKRSVCEDRGKNLLKGFCLIDCQEQSCYLNFNTSQQASNTKACE